MIAQGETLLGCLCKFVFCANKLLLNEAAWYLSKVNLHLHLLSTIMFCRLKMEESTF